MRLLAGYMKAGARHVKISRRNLCALDIFVIREILQSAEYMDLRAFTEFELDCVFGNTIPALDIKVIGLVLIRIVFDCNGELNASALVGWIFGDFKVVGEASDEMDGVVH